MEDRREQSGFEHRNSHDDEETRPTHVHCAQQKMNAQQATYNTCPTQIDLEAMGRACLTEADSVGKALRVMRAPGDMASMPTSLLRNPVIALAVIEGSAQDCANCRPQLPPNIGFAQPTNNAWADVSQCRLRPCLPD